MKSNAQEERRNPNDEKKIKLKKGRRNFEKFFQSSKNDYRITQNYLFDSKSNSKNQEEPNEENQIFISSKIFEAKKR